MKQFLLLVLISILTFSSCQKKDIDCLTVLINDFEKHASCSESKVDEFDFNGKKVYLFNNSFCCCDYASDVYDSECKLLGFIGGIAGNSIIEGEDFTSAKYVKTIWKK